MIPPALELFLKSGRGARIRVTGSSMRPILTEGSEILIEPGFDNIALGDIILFFRGNRLVTHRVVNIKGHAESKRFLTKGDSALNFDKPLIAKEEIIGIGIKVIRGKNVIDLRKKRWRIVALFLLFFSVITGIFPKTARLFFRLFRAPINLMGLK